MELRFRLIVLTLVGLIAVAVWTFPAWRGFFRERSAQAAFPGLALDLQDDFLSLPPDTREALLNMRASNADMAMDMLLVAIRDPQAAPVDDRSAVNGARALASGEFQALDALHWGVGEATIYELADATRILRFEDFRSAPGGDVRVYLARDHQPLSALQLGDDFLDLGRLKGNVGDQSYFLPANHDLSVYNSAVVFCRQFNMSITVATLR
ncbi:MAG: DM13 domain-containing protein [Chloroflexota bacterium]|nr:DM13 domain-containing protein [Chloroflexota bacterium]MDE2856076.1 DM13 domain-containing protein [Chloroflexota bacterium]MDE2947145.1 DM13 domain-containing protein [Chloroflexota bacterium]